MDDGELLRMDDPAGLRGVSAAAGLDPPQPVNAAVIDDHSGTRLMENEFSQGGDVRGCDLQGIKSADQPPSGAESPGRAAGEPGSVEASEALPAASGDFSAAALQQRVERMLVAGGDGPVRSGWPVCSAQVTNELVLNAMQGQRVLAVFLAPDNFLHQLPISPLATSLAAATAAAGSLAAVNPTASSAATALTTARRALALAAAIAAASLPSQRPRSPHRCRRRHLSLAAAVLAAARRASPPPPSPVPNSSPPPSPLRSTLRRRPGAMRVRQ